VDRSSLQPNLLEQAMNSPKLNPKKPPACPVDIEPRDFPDKPLGGNTPPATVDNVRHMLAANGVTARYNVIKKKTEIVVPWLVGTAENADSVAMTHILSLASRYGMPTGLVPGVVEALGDENAYNPAAVWMKSRPWDGVDRLPAMYRTLTVRPGYPEALRDILVHKWLLSVAAAALMPDGFRTRGVLTLQGPQGIGKTSWGLSLIDDPVLKKTLIKTDHHLDAGNKDSLLGVIDHLIAEIGELESSLRRDVSRLKGFLTSGSDKLRRPYGRVTVEYQRRTVFYATVNAADFLVDTTGNTRWWTIPVVAIDFDHGVDMQQLFAQLAVELEAGGKWWLTAEEEALLEEQNSHHRSFSLVQDQLLAVIDPDVEDTLPHPYVTASETLEAASIDHPTNAQAKECASLLREWFGEPKRIHGRFKWRVPFRSGHQPIVITPEPSSPTKSKFD
jgi:putative DNA primase/helicase